MRRRRFVPGFVLLIVVGLTACGSVAGRDAAAPTTTAATPPVVAHTTDPALLIATSDGTVSMRTTTGAVAFRALNGVAAPDRSTIVQAEPMTSGTRVVASDPITGVARWQRDVAGQRRVRVVSPGGRDVALVDGTLVNASTPRTSTVVDVVTAKGAHAYTFAGNLDPEAFSTDGRTLFVLDFLPAANPSRYSVREVDLASGRMRAVPDQDGSVRAPMPGYAQAQVMSPDGTRLYTFYASAEPIKGDDGDEYHTWVHVLDLEHKWAHCLELDEDIGVNGDASGALALSADDKRLFVSDRTSGAIVAIDTRTLQAVGTRFVTDLVRPGYGALLATTGSTLFLNDTRGLVRVDANTLEPLPGVVASSEEVTSVRADQSGQQLFVLATDGVFVLDRRGRQLARWALPGNATSIAPPSVPGRGTYQCAC